MIKYKNMLSDVLKEFDNLSAEVRKDREAMKQFITEQISKAIDEVTPDIMTHDTPNTGNTYNQGIIDGYNGCQRGIRIFKDKFLNN